MKSWKRRNGCFCIRALSIRDISRNEYRVRSIRELYIRDLYVAGKVDEARSKSLERRARVQTPSGGSRVLDGVSELFMVDAQAMQDRGFSP